MMDYFVDTCNYNEDDAKDVVNELLIERYYEETGDDFDVQAVYRLKAVHIQCLKLTKLKIRVNTWFTRIFL